MGIQADRTPLSSLERPSVHRRIAAGAALLALLAAIVVVAVSLARNPGRLLVALVLVVVIVAAGWSALLHRGVRRAMAALVALAALVVLVLLLDVTSIVRLALVGGLLLAATAAATVAFAHDLAAKTAGEARAVGAALGGVLLMNPWSGGGKVTRFQLADQARRRGITPVSLRRGDDLRALAEQAVAAGADVIGMAGGDGSQALVADVARRHDVAFVCVPAGTRNHFALDLGLDRENVVAALDAYTEAIERRVDLAMLGDRVFVNNASLGVYAATVQSSDYRDAKLATTAQRLPELLGPGAEPFDLRFTCPDGTSGTSADLVLVSNNAYRLNRFNGFGTRERLDAGFLGIVTVTVNRARDLPLLLSAEAAGQLERFPGYRQWTTPEFEINSEQELLDVGVDGEALRLPPPLRFRSLPGALRVRIPVHAPGAAPAALAPAGIGLATSALFRILRGHPAF